MRQFLASCLLLIGFLALTSKAFAPQPAIARQSVFSPTRINAFNDDRERETITRDSEPEDFFAT